MGIPPQQHYASQLPIPLLKLCISSDCLRHLTTAVNKSNFVVMITEREMQISPIVQESVIHNTKTLATLHNLTASLFGVAAGILGLESYPGFLFYIFFTLLTSALVYVFRIAPHMSKDTMGDRYFRGAWEFWSGGLVEGLSGFVLTWTLFYGLVRA